MINIETILAIAGAFGGLEAIKWVVGLKTSRRKASAEAEETIENVIAKRVKSYEDLIAFLQSQLLDKEQRFSELSRKYEDSMQRSIDLTRRLGEMKLKYSSSRCDRKECPDRRPPLPWMRKGAESKY